VGGARAAHHSENTGRGPFIRVHGLFERVGGWHEDRSHSAQTSPKKLAVRGGLGNVAPMKKPLGILFAAVAIAGCSDIGLSTGDGTGGGGPTSSGTGSTGSGAAAQGIDCGTDPDTGAVLCLGISTCPSFMIDSDAFPACGFRISGAVLDLECSCSGELCPIGMASTCSDLTKLTMEKNYTGVCTQVSDGRCTMGTPAGAPDAAAIACQQSCNDMCAGDPTCIKACTC
jgi:hypothetical protein